MIDQLRAVVADIRDAAFNELPRRSAQMRGWANRIDALLPPPQPEGACDAVPFVSVAEADKYAKEHTR